MINYERLRKMMHDSHETFTSLSAKGIPVQSIQRGLPIKTDTLSMLCEYFDCQPEDLVSFKKTLAYRYRTEPCTLDSRIKGHPSFYTICELADRWGCTPSSLIKFNAD